MADLGTDFEERWAEIAAYLDFLEGIENLIKSGVPRLGEDGPTVTVLQQRILYSSVYVQLYNLVEASITRCLDALTEVAIASSDWKPNQLVAELRREWVRVIAKSHKELNAHNRLEHAFTLCEHLVNALPLDPFSVEKGGGGNWDDKAIEHVLERVGMRLRLTPVIRRAVKEKFRDDRGALEVIVKLRNDLAHGSISFAECGENDTVLELRTLAHKTTMYLRTIVRAFERFIDGHEFLRPEYRPASA